MASAFFRHARMWAPLLPADRPRSSVRVAATAPRHQPAMQLAPRSPIVLADPEYQTIVCDDGMVWITQGDGSDYVLTAGQSLALRPRDDVVIMAMNAPAIIRRTGRNAATTAAG
ncbi:MAG TPA: DUF2917 domain-containing protein [Paucimonas sp.]|nr:DUF2917 domain-containing protein [Paucimonas sp.]